MGKVEKVLFWILVASISAILLFIATGAFGIIDSVSAETLTEEREVLQEQQPDFEIIELAVYPHRGEYVEYKTIDHEEGVICYNTLSHHGGVHNSHKNSYSEKWCFHKEEE